MHTKEMTFPGGDTGRLNHVSARAGHAGEGKENYTCNKRVRQGGRDR